MAPKPASLVLYRGPSMLDPDSWIVATMTLRPKNRKTGGLLGVTIVPDLERHADRKAVRPDASICPGDCPFRDVGGCYVNWAFGPRSTQRAAVGRSVASVAEVIDAIRGKLVRLGQAGDPAALPDSVLGLVEGWADGWTAYTHAWRSHLDGSRPILRRMAMASCETVLDAATAVRAGWRAYLVRKDDRALRPNLGVPGARVAPCPAGVGEATCDRCMLCDGASARAGRPDVLTIAAHGGAVAARQAARTVGA